MGSPWVRCATLLVVFAFVLATRCQAAERSRDDLAAEIAMICAAMKANADKLLDYDVQAKVEQTTGTSKRGVVIRMRWVQPGVFVAQEVMPGSGQGTMQGPLVERGFDGKYTYTAYEVVGTPKGPKRDRGPSRSRTGIIERGTGTGEEMGAFTTLDPWFRTLFFGTEAMPLWELLREFSQSGEIAIVKPESRFGSRGQAIHGETRGVVEYDFWIDEEHGGLPRVQRFSWRRSGRTTETQVSRVSEQGGVWFPIEVSTRTQKADGSSSTVTTTVLNVAVNKGIPEDDLRFAFKPGTLVEDRVRGRSYVVRPWWHLWSAVGIFIAGLVGVIFLFRYLSRRRVVATEP